MQAFCFLLFSLILRLDRGRAGYWPTRAISTSLTSNGYRLCWLPLFTYRICNIILLFKVHLRLLLWQIHNQNQASTKSIRHTFPFWHRVDKLNFIEANFVFLSTRIYSDRMLCSLQGPYNKQQNQRLASVLSAIIINKRTNAIFKYPTSKIKTSQKRREGGIAWNNGSARKI